MNFDLNDEENEIEAEEDFKDAATIVGILLCLGVALITVVCFL